MKLKNNFRQARATIFIMAMLAVCGCYESPFPLDPTPQAPLDDRLMGGWRCLPSESDANSSAATLTISTVRAQVYQYTFQADGETPETYEAYTSLVNGQPVLNILEQRQPDTWVFGRYQMLRPNVLQVQIADADRLDDKYETPEALRQALIQKRDQPQLYSDLMTCVRIKQKLGG